MANDDLAEGCFSVILVIVALVAAVAIFVYVVLPLVGISIGLGALAGGLECAGRWLGHLWRVCTRPLSIASPPASDSDETFP